MSLAKHLKKALTENSLSKAEKPELGEGVNDGYKERASKGGDILWHVTIKGQKELSPGIPLHMSLKVFEDKKQMDLDEIKQKVKELGIKTPDPTDLTFKTTIFTSERDGKKYYMLLVGGTDKAYSHFYESFKHTGTVYKKFMPHITIDKGLYDKINKEGIKPDEVIFRDLTAEYGAGNTIHSFDEKELEKSESLEKGALKTMLTAGSMAAALASPHTTDAKVPSHGPLHPQVSASPNSDYSREKMLNAISQVESSGGKNMNHKPTSQGTAYGRWAVMPSVIQDTIRLNPKLKQQYGKGLRLQGDNLTHYMQDNPKLEQEIVNSHLNRLEHHFGHNPEAIAYGWNQGITNTNRSLKAKKDISAHPYVQKFKRYYESGK
jgi:hypothetical protein